MGMQLLEAIRFIAVCILVQYSCGEELERGLISYVLENFDVQDVQDKDAANLLLDAVDIWEETFNNTFVVSMTEEALHGTSALRLDYKNSQGGEYVLQSILEETAVHAGARGATHAFFSYRHRLIDDLNEDDNDFTWRLILFDSNDCEEECSEVENLEAWEYVGGLLSVKNEWQTVGVPLDSDQWIRISTGNGNSMLDLPKIKGWRLEFSSDRSGLEGTIIVDQLAVDGDGSMIGTAFNAASWEEALEDQILARIYYESDISTNETHQIIHDGQFYVNYTVQQTETWGGFIQYSFMAPGRAYFNMSRAEGIATNYKIIEPASVPGRTHVRFLMQDASDCWSKCGHFSPNVENYYSFHFILDKPGNDTEGLIAVQLQGDGNSGSPFWRTGWFGTIGNDVLDKAYIKGYKIEISTDSQGGIDSLVSGIFQLSDMRAQEVFSATEIDTSMCIVEPDLRFRMLGTTKFRRVEFLDFNECCESCNIDESCMIAFSNGVDCFKTDYVHHDDLGYWSDMDATLLAFVKQSDEDFCDVCDCYEEDQTIDCRDKDLVVVPRTFSPSGDSSLPGPPSWTPKVLILTGNPRLVILQAGALDNLESLEELYLPANLKHISPTVLEGLSKLTKLDFEKEGHFSNFITSASSTFSDICCGLGQEVSVGAVGSSPTTLTFCDFKPDRPGVDAVYEDFIQYFDAHVLDAIKPTSSFLSEAAKSAEFCAEYCNIHSDCNYFTYDDRYVNAEPVCFLLETKGEAKSICCRAEHYGNIEGTLPGYISGMVPRARNKNFGARVLLDSSSALVANEDNAYTVQFHLKLGSMPLRGAVWVEPTVVARKGPTAGILISPKTIVLYDNATVATVNVTVKNVAEMLNGGKLVIENSVSSCDTAFSIVKPDLTVFVDIVIPKTESDTILILLIAIGSSLFAVLCLTAYFLRRAERRRKQADTVWHVEPEELQFQDPPKVLGRGSFGLVLLAEYRGTHVAVKRVMPPRGRGAKNKGTQSMNPTCLVNFSEMFGDTETDGSSGSGGSNGERFGGLSQNFLGRSSVGLVKKYRGATAAVASGMHAAQNKYWQNAFETPQTESHATLRAQFLEEMRHLSKLRHPNVCTFMGAVVKRGEEPMLLMEYMDHGSLYDILHNETMVLDGEHILPILSDITSGVRFLHAATPKVIHGDLKASNILVDSRLRAKVADFGLSQKKKIGATGTPYWMAPELLRGVSSNTTASDVFSFGVILYEVYSRKDPYEGENFSDVMEKLVDPTNNKRPGIPEQCPQEIESLMRSCLEEAPEKRPSFKDLDLALRGIDVTKVEPCYLRREKKDTLLEEVFPPHIAQALREGRKVEPETREVVSIVFSDIVGFTTIASQLSAIQVSEMLDRLYQKFDALSHKHDVFKVETIGDSWMGVTNLVKDQPDHAQRVARFAIDAMKAAQETWVDTTNHSLGKLNLRMGFHSGQVVANVVGSRNPRYCLFGDSVNTASRMESHSIAGHIQCSEASAKILMKEGGDVKLKERGKTAIKGKGTMLTYWVGMEEEAVLEETAPLATEGNVKPVTFEKGEIPPEPTHTDQPEKKKAVEFSL